MIFQNTLVQGIAFFIPNKKLRHAFRAKYKRKTKYRQLKDKYIELENQLKTVHKQPAPGKYTALQYLAAMLKAYGIENVIASSGTTHAMFCLTLQNDSFFKIYSVADERSAAYAATGMSYSLGKPVVITCTQATASRNYPPGLTEAFYRNIPIIAAVFFAQGRNSYNMSAQYIDRSITQNDIKVCQVRLPDNLDATSRRNIITYINTAIYNALHYRKPVIIECPTSYDFKNLEKYLPLPNDFWITKTIYEINQEERDLLKGKRVAVFIGSHQIFSAEQQDVLSEFAKSYNAPVLCSHTSGYHGANKILLSLAAKSKCAKPEIVIDIGGVTEGAGWPFSNAPIYRISEDGEFRCRDNRAVNKIFVMKEQRFFSEMKNDEKPQNQYFQEIQDSIGNLQLPDLPLSAFLVAQKLSELLPKGSSVHFSILNAIRAANFFYFPPGVTTSSNVGGFGIDGSVSTVLGEALANREKTVYAIIGDLAFFYDMNAIQNRDLKDNLRILLINNNQGVEMNINRSLRPYRDQNDKVIVAANHRTVAGGWVKDCGLYYMCSRSKDDFLSKIGDFCNKDFGKSVVFEVFTNPDDEINAYELMTNMGIG